MSYSVIHMTKLKMGAMKGIENHNERSKDSRTNPDIDDKRSHLNYDLHRSDDSRTYYMRTKDRISELDLPKAIRKDAVVSVGFITTSDKAFFDGLTPEQSKKFFQASYDFLKERYGEKNVISSKVHLDERTPHMHTYIVPVTQDGRLSAKSIFTPVELKSLQTDYNRHMREHGFNLDKGENTRTHIEMAEYKKQTAFEELRKVEGTLSMHTELSKSVEKQFKELSDNRDSLMGEVTALKTDLKGLRSDLERVKDIKVAFNEIDAIQGEFGLIGKKKVKVKTEDFDKLKDIGKRQHVLETKLERLERDNKSLSQDLDKYRSRDMDTYKKDIEREKQLKGMAKEIDTVKDFLVDTNQLESYRKFREEQELVKKQMQKQMQKDAWDLER